MDGLPGVSVVIPTYNRAGMLRAAVKSVLAQTVPVSEIAVVDDGSTDETPTVIDQLVTQGAPIIYLRGPHRNQRGTARNRGVEATGAPVVAFLDSDDLWLPERVERQLMGLASMPDAGFAFCNLRRFDENGLMPGRPYLPMTADYNGDILGDVLEEALAVSSTLMVRREAFERVGGFTNLRMNEDYEITLRLATSYSASYLSEPLVLIREHAGRTSRSYGEMPLLDYIRIVRTFLSRHPGLPAETQSRGRRGLANAHFKLARLLLERGERARARQHLRALVKLRPWDRRTPGAYLRSWLPMRTA